ncbi:hypothetical protein [Nocardioides sp.]|uniref:hypothetical protein n=1 Tax=Nocardioides sp. TaxID=35761 RepID=UPI002B26823E|nr:hypothetical protein [Nocardioides sp.]
MTQLSQHLVRLLGFALMLALPADRRRDERGDVPGWVLVTIMTVGLMAAISALAGEQLTSMLQSALNSVQ